MPRSEKDADEMRQRMLRDHGAWFLLKSPQNDRVKAGANRARKQPFPITHLG